MSCNTLSSYSNLEVTRIIYKGDNKSKNNKPNTLSLTLTQTLTLTLTQILSLTLPWCGRAVALILPGKVRLTRERRERGEKEEREREERGRRERTDPREEQVENQTQQ